MNAKTLLTASVALAAAGAFAFGGGAIERAHVSREKQMSVKADRMAVDNLTGNAVATGNVVATMAPFRLLSDSASRTDNVIVFSEPTLITTCTNDLDHLHWSLSGSVVYREREEIVARNLLLKMWGYSIGWVPYWWQPLETDYGWRVMPGYTSRWGAYLLTKYVYTLAGSMQEGSYGLGGNTRFDLRTKNGIALGQSVKWNLGDYGMGKFKVYYAWDRDADRYDRHWQNDRRWNYSNWSSDVPDERYGLSLEHQWLVTERDSVRLNGAIFSDTMFRYDFLRTTRMGLPNRFADQFGNEVAWSHMAESAGWGVRAAGPINDFYDGVARLPEAYLALMPQPLPGGFALYESDTVAGFLNRTYGKIGSKMTSLPYRYRPGLWADYQAFRFDTYHRLSAPFRMADAVSVVPRVGLRGTFWSDCGNTVIDGASRAGSRDDAVSRGIIEGGVTFAARGEGELGESWLHTIEPYADVLAQKAKYSGLSRGARPYIFDSRDASVDWLDQFAGRSRNLPYSWYGVVPGVRNIFRRRDGAGQWRTCFDIDFYTALQFNDTDWTDGGPYHRLARDPADPLYGHDGEMLVVPGLRARWFVSQDTTLSARAEWDGENDTVAYADVVFSHRLSGSFLYEISYMARDHRVWDYASTPFDPAVMRDEDLNRADFSLVELRCEHELCDSFAYGPFIRWDCRRNEVDEVGGWFDLRTDCLGFRFSVSYTDSWIRTDGSEYDSDWRCGVGVYLRAFGPGAGSTFGD